MEWVWWVLGITLLGSAFFVGLCVKHDRDETKYWRDLNKAEDEYQRRIREGEGQ